MLGLAYPVYANACSDPSLPFLQGREFIFGMNFLPSVGEVRWGLWYILHNRQQPLELRRHGYCHMVAERQDLIANTLERIAEPTAVDDKATRNSCALRVISYQLKIHDFILCSGSDSLCR